jgi:protein gp37
MAENTKIEWADHTFNPWTGCQKVSPGCDHCYAEGWSKRSGVVEWGPHAPRRRTSPANWAQPLKWNRQAKAEGRRARVFCASLADVFDNHPSITSGWHGDLWHLIAATPHLDWLLLTKRPQNIIKMMPESYGAPAWGYGWPNVWLGTTVENQTEADRRIPVLLSIPAKVRFLSCEPLLGPLDLTRCGRNDLGLRGDALRWPGFSGPSRSFGHRIDWVICGGESGPGARPMHPDWARSLRDQCQAAGVPFLFKQWGEWAPAIHDPEHGGHVLRQTEPVGSFDSWKANAFDPNRLEGINWRRLGKKAAGRHLDGRTWDEVPR